MDSRQQQQQQYEYMRAPPPPPPPPPPSMADPSPRPPLPPPSQSTWYPNNQFQYQPPPPPPPPQPTSPWSNNNSDHLHQHPPPPHQQQHPYPPQPQNQYYPPQPPPPPPPLYPHSHSSQPYPQPNAHQTWGNRNQPLHQVWEHPDRTDPNNNEDWAAKAREWSAAKSAMENQHQPSQFTHIGRSEEQNYGFQDQYQPAADPHYTNFQQPSLPASSHQQFSSSSDPHMIPANHMHESSSFSSGPSSYYAPDSYASYASRDGPLGADPNSVYSHQGNISTNSSEYQQEVPSSYSSVPGKGAVGGQNVPLHTISSFPVSSGQETQYHGPPTLSAPGRSVSEEQPYFAYGAASAGSIADPSDRPLEFAPGFNSNHESHDQHPHSSYMHPDPYSTGSNPTGPVGYVDHLTPASSFPSLTPPVVPGMGYPPSGLQFDSSFISPGPAFGQIHGANFRHNLPNSGAGFGLSAGNIHHTAAFPGDLNGIASISDRPKKAVPNWLREEIIKSKAVIANSSQAPREEDPDDPAEDDDSQTSIVKHGPSERKSIDSSMSSDEDDDEDAIEAARTAAINQEIKRVLTEVLLKVTDELFDEIATRVLSEDDPSIEVGHSNALPKQVSSSPPPFPAPKASAKVLLPSIIKGSKSDDVSSKSPSVTAGGDILGLGNYASDDDDYDHTVNSIKSTRSRMDAASSPSGTELSGNMHEVVENGDSRPETKELSTSGTIIDNYQDEVGLADSSIKATSREKELRFDELDKIINHDKEGLPKLQKGGTRIQEVTASTNAESLVEAATILKSKDAGDVISKSVTNVNQARSKSDRNLDMESTKNYSSNDVVKDAGSGDLKVISKYSASGEGSREDRHARKERKEDKNGVKDRGRKSEDRTRESDYRRNSHSKDDRPEIVKGKKDSTKDDSGRKRVPEKEDRLRHHGGRDSSIHKRRYSPSVGSKAGNGKDNSVASHDNESSDESSEDSRRRKKHSRKRSFSPSPNRSKRRHVSRSPHSKHSHRRQSSYSSLDSRRGRRSRSRSRSRSKSPVRRRK